MEKQVLEQVDRNRIIELARNLADIVSITGEEEEVAKYLGGEFEKLGMEVEYQYVEDGRPNVIGRLKGSGGGATLMFRRRGRPDLRARPGQHEGGVSLLHRGGGGAAKGQR
jgi:acetylornithine deacetylase/succinyl-diaminopimelate desuccinylase-like protein